MTYDLLISYDHLYVCLSCPVSAEDCLCCIGVYAHQKRSLLNGILYYTRRTLKLESGVNLRTFCKLYIASFCMIYDTIHVIFLCKLLLMLCIIRYTLLKFQGHACLIEGFFCTFFVRQWFLISDSISIIKQHSFHCLQGGIISLSQRQEIHQPMFFFLVFFPL